MAGQRRSLEISTFVAGLNTEAGPLTFPENASLAEKNFILDVDGSRQRRLGLDWENDKVTRSATFLPDRKATTAVIDTFEWKNAGNRGDLDIVVVHVGNTLYFFDTSSEIISSNLLTTYSLTVGEGLTRIYGTSIYGRFVLSTGTTSVTVFELDPQTLTVTNSKSTIEVRDTWGLEDNLETDERKGTITINHDYNLRNQGWPRKFICFTQIDGGADDTDPVVNTEDTRDFYPSNADVIWNGKTTGGDTFDEIGRYSAWELLKNGFGVTPAPKGKHILKNVFARGFWRNFYLDKNSGINWTDNLDNDYTYGTIGAVAAYAGRVFYSVKQERIINNDALAPNLGTMIFFSKVAANIGDIGKCHSENDPTAEDFNKPLDTDGGFISIPEMGRVIAMEPLGNSLFVFASNGVWEIHGGEGSFSATNQNLAKVTNSGCNSQGSVVVGEGIMAYWSEGGIYAIELDGVSLRGVARNITQNTIQSIFNKVPAEARANVTGIYDEASRQVRWLVRTTTLPNPYLFDSEVIFDLTLKAWYINEISTTTSGNMPYTAGYIPVPFLIFGDVTDDVTVEGTTVTVNGVDVSITTREVDTSIVSSIKYLAGYVNDVADEFSFSFAQYNNREFLDWGEVDAEALLLTGYWTGQTASKEKYVQSVTVHMKRTESGFTTEDGGDSYSVTDPSGCLMQAQWAWSDSPAAGRWGVEQQAYKLKRFYSPDAPSGEFDYSATVISTRNTLNGHGEALSLQFKSEPGKACHIYGWSKELLVESET